MLAAVLLVRERLSIYPPFAPPSQEGGVTLQAAIILGRRPLSERPLIRIWVCALTCLRAQVYGLGFDLPARAGLRVWRPLAQRGPARRSPRGTRARS